MIIILLTILTIGDPFWGTSKDFLNPAVFSKQLNIEFDDRGCLSEGSLVVSQGKIVGEVSSISNLNGLKGNKINTSVAIDTKSVDLAITDKTLAVITCPMVVNIKKIEGIVELLNTKSKPGQKPVQSINGFSSFAKLWSSKDFDV